jgi:hypothetical protein
VSVNIVGMNGVDGDVLLEVFENGVNIRIHKGATMPNEKS